LHGSFAILHQAVLQLILKTVDIAFLNVCLGFCVKKNFTIRW